MKIKLLLSVLILFISECLNAQWSPYVYTLTQKYGTVPGTFVYSGTASSVNSASSGSSQGFLPIPPSGTARVIITSTGTTNAFKLSTNNSLEFVSGTTNTGGTAKYSVHGIPEASDVVYSSFNIAFSGLSTTGEYNLGIGNQNASLFTGLGGIYKSSPEIFMALKWAMGTGSTISFSYRVGANAATTNPIVTWSTINSTSFVKNNSYKVEIYANNNSASQVYTRGTSSYNLPSNTFHIWVNSARVGGDYPRSIEVAGSDPLSTGTSIAIPNGVPLNSFLFTASEKGTVSHSIKLSNVETTYRETSPVNSEVLQAFKQNPAGSVLPDFSYAGYHHGEERIPTISSLRVFDVTKSGAIPNDQISDRAAIIKAIDSAVNNKSGIIFFPPGRYLVNEDNDVHAPISIRSNNIIFRGSGSGPGGTEIFMKNELAPTDPTKLYSTPFMFNFENYSSPTLIDSISQASAKGTFNITLKNNVTNLVPGNWVMLKVLSKDTTLRSYDFGSYKVDSAWTSITTNGIQVEVIHQIQSISNKVITLKSPVTYPIDPKYGWTVSKYNNYAELGVEDIAFVGNFTIPFVHHRSALDDSGYSMVKLSRLTNSWVKNCRFKDVNVGLAVKSGANISIVNCTMTGNPAHEAIYNERGTNIFMGKLSDTTVDPTDPTKAGMWHSFGVNALAMNTVIWRTVYPGSTSFESHSSQPRNTLLDYVEGGLSYNRAGGDIVNVPNHLANLVFWNYKQTNAAVNPFLFWPLGTENIWHVTYPIVVGSRGSKSIFLESQLKYSENTGSEIAPESLYQEQLKFRLGYQPSWLDELYKSSELTGVLVYDQTNYNGRVVSLQIGNYTQTQLVNLGIANDSLKSIKVPQGYDVQLFVDDNFTGNSDTIGSNTKQPQLSAKLMGKVSSLKIIASSDSSNVSALSVSLTSFKGSGETSGNVLRWETVSERDNSHFDVLRSADGKVFNWLGTIRGNGNTDESKNYSFVDHDNLKIDSYYQLKQVDFSGKSTSYGPIAVHNELYQSPISVNVFGNTVKTNLTIESSSLGLIDITFYDLNGRKVLAVKRQISSKITDLSLPPMPATGVYVVEIKGQSLDVIKKFMVF